MTKLPATPGTMGHSKELRHMEPMKQVEQRLAKPLSHEEKWFAGDNRAARRRAAKAERKK